MIEFTKWENRKLSVDSIRLDRRNPRIAGDSSLDLNQIELIHLLVRNADVRDIAKRIRSNGYFPFYQPIVVKEGRHFVVIEGNRRLAALKILRNPELAPPELKRFFVNLSVDIDPVSIEKIDVMIAPCRSDVDVILYTIHASESAKSWNRLMKHQFVAGKILQGEDINFIASKFNVQVSEIKEAVQEILLLSLAQSLDLDPAVKEHVLSKDFPLSTLHRIIGGTKSFTLSTGFQIKEKSFKTDIPENQFRSIMTQIFTDLATGDIDSRTLHDEKSRTEYINNLVGEYIDDSIKGEWEYVPFVDATHEDSSATRPPRPRRARQRLIPNTEFFSTGNTKLDALIEEGQLMPLGTYRNSSAMLLRTILQIAICQIFCTIGKPAKIKARNGNNKGLEELIRDLAGDPDVGISESLRDRLRRLFEKSNPGFYNIRTLHDYVHDEFQQPEKVVLSNFWGVIEPVVQLCCSLKKD